MGVVYELKCVSVLEYIMERMTRVKIHERTKKLLDEIKIHCRASKVRSMQAEA